MATAEGLNLTFGHQTTNGKDVILYVTEIRDANGNRIQIHYHDGNGDNACAVFFLSGCVEYEKTQVRSFAMRRAANDESDISGTTAVLTYAVDTGEKPVDETFGLGNIQRRQSGATEQRTVDISNGRPLLHEFSLDQNGFVLVEHPTAVTDFFDVDQLKTVYYPEMERLVQATSGASRVVVFDYTLRSGDERERERRLIREPVLSVHNDYTEWSGPQRVREVLPDEAERLLAHRLAIIQVWRAIDRPIQANPLAIADARSLSAADLIIAERRYPHRVGETYRVRYSPGHRWFYFPQMRRDEALVFKVYDSKKDGRARFTAHTSFTDPTSPHDAPSRQSIEVRTFAFFDPS